MLLANHVLVAAAALLCCRAAGQHCAADAGCSQADDGMVRIEPGTYEVGTDEPVLPADGEAPLRMVTLPGFLIDKFEVSNEQFEQFVRSTGHVTDAEQFGVSFALELHVSKDTFERFVENRVAAVPWWLPVKGASWRQPEGPDSSLAGRQQHPVVHVSQRDAAAYCRWRRKRLPTEAEWEAACRGRLSRRLFPWGSAQLPAGRHRMNIWQGDFPTANTAEDGYSATAPVTAYGPQNKYGLYNMVGNVWEWTDSLWQPGSEEFAKRGGSFMCHKSHCYRYRCAARSHNTPDTSSSNSGFRCASDLPPA